MWKQSPAVIAVLIVVVASFFVAPEPSRAAAGPLIWGFNAPGDIGGFHGQPSNGASDQVSWVSGGFASEGDGAIKIDYTGSRGMNTAVRTSTLPEQPWNSVVTISADVYVPAAAQIARIGFGIQAGGPTGKSTDTTVHLLNVRGGWNHMSWPVHPGQLSGPSSTFGFVLDTDDPMPAPLYIDNIQAIQPRIAIDAGHVISTFDPVTLWGNNIAYYYPPSFLADPKTATLARDAGFSFFRIPGGLNSDVYHWNGNGVRNPDGSINPAARRADGTWKIDYSGWAPGFEVKGEGIAGDPLATFSPNFAQANGYDHTPPVDVKALAHWIMGLDPQAQMMVDVNVGTGSALRATGPNNSLQESDVATGAEEAAQWVRLYNQQMGLHVKFWEVGNELNPFGAEMGAHIQDSSPQGWHWISAADYATIFRAYAHAMKAVDPSILIAGPVGYFNAPADGSGAGNWMQGFLKLAGNEVDVLDMHFYDAGRKESEYLSVPPNLETQVETMRSWIQSDVPQRAGQIGIGVSEWGDYNNLYPIGDGLFSADLMGEMAKSGLMFGNAWDIGNMIPDNGSPVPMFGFSPAVHDSGGWSGTPISGASNALSWTNDSAYTRPGSTSMAVDVRGSIGDNIGLSRSTKGINWKAADEIRADVFVPQVPGDDAVSFWLQLQNADGSVDNSYRNQPQSTIWGQWNRLIFPIDPAKFAKASRIAIVASSPISMTAPIYFSEIETQKTLRQPNARYWAAYMYHHYFSNTLVDTSIGEVSRDRLAAYASRSPDGALYLMVVNKDPVSDVGIPISIAGYTPAPYAEAYTWGGNNYSWDASQGLATRDMPPTMRVISSAGNFSYVFPRYSITAIKFYPK